jgi:inositol 1,4,5-triphosphate receptor type 1/inositol 1,4,5-triphosphate receptor type 3
VLSHIGRKDLKWRSLKEFNEESLQNDDLQSWSYFLSYFNLLSDVCMNRNKFAKKYVEENFSLSILCSVIEDPDCMETNSIEPFLKLIHFAYINC